MSWIRYLAAGAAGVALFALIPSYDVRGIIYLIVGLVSLIAIVRGIGFRAIVSGGSRRGRQEWPDPRGWWFIAAGTALWLVADIVVVYDKAASDPIYLVGYAAFTVALIRIVDPVGRRLGPEEVVDGGIIAVSFALVSWLFVIGCNAPMSGSVLPVPYEMVSAVAFTSLDVFLLTLVGYRIATRESRSLSMLLLSTAIVVVAVADYVSYIAGKPDFVAQQVLQGCWLASFLFLAAAVHRRRPLTTAVHADGPVISTSTEPRVIFGRRRMSLLVAAALITPTVMIVELVRHVPVERWGWVVVNSAIVMVVLVSVRMFLFVRMMRAQADELADSARTDPLTGLANRRFLGQRLARMIAGEQHSSIALMVVDLVRFTYINETFGYTVGDRVLHDVAGRLLEVLGPEDLVGRLGGDEFVVVLAGDARHASAVESARRIARAVAGPLTVHDIDIQLEASIGIAVSTGLPRPEAEILLQRAHLAVTEAKQRQPRLAVYNRSMDIDRHDQMRLMGELGPALTEGQLCLYYQPRLDLTSDRVAGVEALLRWQHPTDGILTPARFLPSAEESGMLPHITAFVLDAALEQCGAWRAEGLDIEVAVNLSVRNLLDSALPESVRCALDRHGLPGSAVAFEITESSAMTDPDRAVDALLALRRLGVSISIDDYGTGYSSLAYLRTLPVQQLKIDQSFVTTMTIEPNNATIVRSTIDLARDLGVSVVAEGVEDAETLDALRELGCDGVQGYHIGRPAPASRVAALIAEIDARSPSLRTGSEL